MPAGSLTARITAAWLSRGPLAISLLPLAALYGALTALRRSLYDLGGLKSQPIPVPVLVVGNRVAGGAGKTPTTIAIVNHLRSQGWRVGVVSRGHGSQSAGVKALDESATAADVGDEPLLIWRRTRGVPVVVGKDRVSAALTLLEAHPDTDLIVCDDGLQHLRLARDVEVIVFDERGAGNGWLLPAGPLRESIHTRSTARRQITLYNAARASTALPGHLAARSMSGACKLQEWWQGQAPQPWASLIATEPNDWLALAGIAVPERFFQPLRQAGLKIRPFPLADHFAFDAIPWADSERRVILTEKDAVKLNPERLARERPACEVWVAALDFTPAPSFFAELDAALQVAKAAKNSSATRSVA